MFTYNNCGVCGVNAGRGTNIPQPKAGHSIDWSILFVYFFYDHSQNKMKKNSHLVYRFHWMQQWQLLEKPKELTTNYFCSRGIVFVVLLVTLYIYIWLYLNTSTIYACTFYNHTYIYTYTFYSHRQCTLWKRLMDSSSIKLTLSVRSRD